MHRIDPTLPSASYLKLTSALSCKQTNLLTQLRTGHIPLYAHLARIRKTPSAACPTCSEAPETVAHYLLHCPTYALTRATIFAPLGRARRTLRDLLNTKKGIKLLFRYVNATRRFQRIFGTLQDLPDDFDEDDTPGAAAQRSRTRGRRQGT